MIELIPCQNEDQNFVALVERILNFGVGTAKPKDVFVTKVDHWFDFKWRAFSHKMFGSVGVWQKDLRIPPFIPDRIVEESYFEKVGKKYVFRDRDRLHVYQPSHLNAQRKIKGNSATYLWYSGETAKSSQGSLMVYSLGSDFQTSWYASFVRKETWQIYKTNKISKAEVKAMLNEEILSLIR